MIISCDLMVKLDLKANFGRQILEWDEISIPMTEKEKFLGRLNLIKIQDARGGNVDSKNSFHYRRY